MKRKIFYSFVLSSLILIGARLYLVSHPVNTPLPLVKLASPDLSLSADIAAFSGKWEGVWGGHFGRFIGKGIDTTLIVEQISPQQAKVILSYGSNASLKIVQGFNRFIVPVKREPDPTIEWDWGEGGVSFQFSLTDDLNRINGKAKMLKTGEQFSINLHKAALQKNEIFIDRPLVSSYHYQPPQKRNDGWLVGTLAEAKLDENIISDLTKSILSGEYKNTHALLIEHDGKLVYEQYFDGEDKSLGSGQLGHIYFDYESLHDIRSVTKSVTSILLGIAFKNDLDGLTGQSLTDFFDDLPAGDKTNLSQITLKQVLTMTAGLKWNEMFVLPRKPDNDFNRMYRDDDPINIVLSQPVSESPGNVWVYNSGLTEILGEIIQRKTGKPLRQYATEVLFEPLGITDFEWTGSPAWSGDRPIASAGLRMRARDLAKIGSLYLHNGRWEGRQIVPQEWVELSTKRYVEKNGNWSADGIWGYGFQWWLGKFDDPHDYTVIAGTGHGGQRLFIVPKEKIVITIFAGHYGFHVSDETKILNKIVLSKIDS